MLQVFSGPAFDIVRRSQLPHCKSKCAANPTPEFVTTTLRRFNLCNVALCCRRHAAIGEWKYRVVHPDRKSLDTQNIRQIEIGQRLNLQQHFFWDILWQMASNQQTRTTRPCNRTVEPKTWKCKIPSLTLNRITN